MAYSHPGWPNRLVRDCSARNNVSCAVHMCTNHTLVLENVILVYTNRSDCESKTLSI